MTELGIDDCLAAIREGKTFQASVNNGAMSVKIEDYTHFVCTAIHNGHRLRAGLVEKYLRPCPACQ